MDIADPLKPAKLIQVQRISTATPFSLPSLAHSSDVGFDLTVTRYVVIYPRTTVRLPHNFRIAFPQGYYGMILPRSSALSKKGLIVITGLIDPAYRGEVQTVVYNPADRSTVLYESERVSQLIVMRRAAFEVQESPALPEGDRGEEGFGSSGGYSGGAK